MALMIPVPLDLPETHVNVARMEGTVREWGRAVQRQALVLGWAASARLPRLPSPRHVRLASPRDHASSLNHRHEPIPGVTKPDQQLAPARLRY